MYWLVTSSSFFKQIRGYDVYKNTCAEFKDLCYRNLTSFKIFDQKPNLSGQKYIFLSTMLIHKYFWLWRANFYSEFGTSGRYCSQKILSTIFLLNVTISIPNDSFAPYSYPYAIPSTRGFQNHSFKSHCTHYNSTTQITTLSIHTYILFDDTSKIFGMCDNNIVRKLYVCVYLYLFYTVFE